MTHSTSALEQSLSMQEYQLGFGSFQFYPDYVTYSINEGADLDSEKLQQFYTLCKSVFKEQEFGVIELKYASFSTNPLFYLQSKDLLKNVRSHSVVLNHESQTALCDYESSFIKHCPVQFFFTLDDAVNWTLSS